MRRPTAPSAQSPEQLLVYTGWLVRLARALAGRAPTVLAKPVPTSEELVARMAAHQRVARSVLELPEPLRGALLLRYFEDMNAADIARVQGVSAETVRSRLEHALDHLRAALDAGHNGDRRASGSAGGGGGRPNRR